MPSLSASDLEWIYQRDGAEPALCLATITGPELGVVRLVRNVEDVTSRGNVFKASWFDVEEPGDSDEQPVTRFVVPNPDRLVGLHLSEASSGLVVHFEWVRASLLDEVKFSLRALKLRVATITPLTVEGVLSPVQYDTEPYIYRRVSPADFTGLYRMRS